MDDHQFAYVTNKYKIVAQTQFQAVSKKAIS
jgi:hypothetical protein